MKHIVRAWIAVDAVSLIGPWRTIGVVPQVLERAIEGDRDLTVVA